MQSERTITLLQRDFKENVELINSFIEHILGITKIKQKKRTRITLVFKMVGAFEYMGNDLFLFGKRNHLRCLIQNFSYKLSVITIDGLICAN
jgi:hypothetical protein